MTIKIFGIKNCDTVKKALKWLDSEGLSYDFHDFKKEGLSAELADDFIASIPVEILINKRGTTWRKLADGVKIAVQNGDIVAIKSLLQAENSVVKRPVWQIKGEFFVGFKQTEIDPIKSLIYGE